MKKNETLRGRGSFDELFATGRRMEGDSLRCLFRCDPAETFRLAVGFAVPRRAGNAVKRNRVRRLMREAFRQEHVFVRASCADVRRSVKMIFVFRCTGRHALRLPEYPSIHRELSRLCRSVVASACRTP